MGSAVKHIKTSLIAACFLAAFAVLNPANAQSFFERLVLPGDLTAAHADLQKDCSNCHTSFSQGAQSQLCADCHKDIGADLLAKTGFHGKSAQVAASQCSHCHTDHLGTDAEIMDFDPEIFDHGNTDFSLIGGHNDAECSQCHAEDSIFRKAPSACIDCHKSDEPHASALGNDCAACHRETVWTDTFEFDHSKTDFRLEGAHKTVTCEACHVDQVYEGLPTECVDCHRIQDVHRDRFGPKCADCHTETKWTEVRFNHNKDTDFTLTGSHQDATCNSCHQTNVFEHDARDACADCHLSDDVHAASLGTICETCHSTNGWLDDIVFDHGITRFPLLGLHLFATCEECHSDGVFNQTDVACSSCHMPDDAHKGNLGQQCETCHNPNGWAFWIFDHDRQTEYALTGKHEGLKCATCHTPSRATTLNISRACVSCHRNQDIHRGGFGAQCSLCHGTNSFKGARLR